MFKLLTLTMLALMLCVNAFADDELRDERILLTFVPNVQFAPFYMGIEAGYFADAGFNVTLEHLQEPEVLDLVAVGQADFGVVSGEQVILARSRGRDVVYVFEWFQQYPVGLVYASALDLNGLHDLRGLTVGVPGRFGATYSGLITLLQSANLSEDDIELSEIGFNAPEVFCLGMVDAASVYINNEPLQIQRLAQAGQCGDIKEVAVISVSSQVDLVSNGLIVNRALLDSEPQIVQRMVAALAAGLRRAIDNPAAAYLVSVDYVESLPADEALIAALESAAQAQDALLATNPDRAQVAASRDDLAMQLFSQFDADALSQFIILLESIKLWDADQLGASELESWQSMQETLERMGMLGETPLELSQAFSNQFIAAAE